ncbi:MAG: recombination mediator RecR [Acholeplasmatales bacterium]|jgi:recombination protein RecR|nr:recombination mediator RecR [Acholeplasmatales bacterium]
MYPKILTDLIESFSKLPGIGKKTAERLAIYTFSKMKKEDAISFSANIISAKTNLKTCKICNNISDDDICSICKDNQRDKASILIVNQAKDVFSIENTREYHGLYHVINGPIDFTKGVTEKDLALDNLFTRLDGVKEIILALDTNFEGELTSKYLRQLLLETNILVTRLAYGLPVGIDLKYADVETLGISLVNRKKF